MAAWRSFDAQPNLHPTIICEVVTEVKAAEVRSGRPAEALTLVLSPHNNLNVDMYPTQALIFFLQGDESRLS